MITTIISMFFALTLPVTYQELPTMSDLIAIEVYKVEVERAEEKHAQLIEEYNYMRLAEQKLIDEENKRKEAEAQKLKELEVASAVESSKTRNKVPTRGRSTELGVFTVTTYDLSVQSCGKPIGSKGYGITASGFDLTGHTWETARSIAVDPEVIPLGNKVEITFTNEAYSKYNGVYTARDTGGAIKQNKIDFFMGDFKQNKTHQSVWDFGVTKANLKIIR